MLRSGKLRLLKSLYDFLDVSERPRSCDLIVAVAGRPERKSFALELFQQGLAPRLILSVARYDVRRTAELPVAAKALLAVRDANPPARRHFWLEISSGKSLIRHADLNKTGTFGELQALAAYLKPDRLRTIALVSSSLHLRRIQFCCSRIPFLSDKDVLLWAAPAGDRSINSDQWWKNGAACRYLLSEYTKLAGYNFLYRQPRLPKPDR